MKRILLISFLLCSLSLFVSADVKLPSPSGFINDFAGILTAQEKQNLLSVSEKLKQETGAELAIAIVKTTSPLDTKLYAVKLFEKWGIGEKGKDNGVLVLLAMEEKRIEIEVGYGLEGILPDGLVGEILDNYAVPYFKKGEFSNGLYQTSTAIAKVIATKGEFTPYQDISGTGFTPVKKEEPQTSVEFSPALIFVIIGVIILGILLRKGGSIVLGIFGAVVGYNNGALIGAIIGAILGLFFGWIGLFYGGRFGGGGFGRGGGFGGFGGGRSGGGGAGRGW